MWVGELSGTGGVRAGKGQEANGKEGWTTSASGRAGVCRGELGWVAAVNLTLVFRRVRARGRGWGSAPYLEFLQRKRPAERGPRFQLILTSLSAGQGVPCPLFTL